MAASADLVAEVDAVIQRDSVRVLTDTVEVVPCTIQGVTVRASITLYPEPVSATLDTAKAQLEAAFDQQKSLGWDVTKAWITANLFTTGIQNIALESPAEDVVVGDDACAALTGVELTLAGRTW